MDTYTTDEEKDYPYGKSIVGCALRELERDYGSVEKGLDALLEGE